MSLDTADLIRVRKLPLLDAASADSFAQLTRDAVLQSVSRRTALTLEGEVSSCLPILMEGSVALESGRDGQGATLALLEPLSTVMLASVVLDAPALVTASMESWRISGSQVMSTVWIVMSTL